MKGIRWLLWPGDEPPWARVLVLMLALTAVIGLAEGLGWVAFACLGVAMISDRIGRR